MSLQEKLENECDIIQEKWLCVERRYHYLDNMIHIVTSNLQLTALETRCLQGHEIYSFDFPSMEALYNSQIAENEIKAQNLQLQLKKMEDNEVFNIQQVRLIYGHELLQYYFYPFDVSSVLDAGLFIKKLHREKCFWRYRKCCILERPSINE